MNHPQDPGDLQALLQKLATVFFVFGRNLDRGPAETEPPGDHPSTPGTSRPPRVAPRPESGSPPGGGNTSGQVVGHPGSLQGYPRASRAAHIRNLKRSLRSAAGHLLENRKCPKPQTSAYTTHKNLLENRKCPKPQTNAYTSPC